MDNLSRRGHSNVIETMAQLPKAMLESIDDDTDGRGYQEPIDLSVAENWLIREEVLGIGKLAIEKHFDGQVSFTHRFFIFPFKNATDDADDFSPASFHAYGFLGQSSPFKAPCQPFQPLFRTQDTSPASSHCCFLGRGDMSGYASLEHLRRGGRCIDSRPVLEYVSFVIVVRPKAQACRWLWYPLS